MADFSLENTHDGLVCGIDEVGRGPLAGPVVAACVHIPSPIRTYEFIKQIQDSKKLSKSKLLTVRTDIIAHCPYGIGLCTPEEIDELNILWASMLAMRRAFDDFKRKISSSDDIHCLVDGNRIPKDLPAPASAIVKGDSKSKSIAAASILAKVHRDQIMQDLADSHPEYGWAKNAAYPTKEHLQALQIHGITKHHRKSFKPVKALLSQ